MSESEYTTPRWVTEVFREHAGSLRSALILVETNDPKRVDEFLDYCSVLPETWEAKVTRPDGRIDKVTFRRPKPIIYDAFGGLFEMVPDKSYGFVERPLGSGASLLGDNTLQTLDARLMADKPDEREQIVVIRNILKAEDFSGKWPNALNGWAAHDVLLGQGHMIVIFAPSRTVIPSEVLDKAIYYVPPMSEEDERRTKLLEASAKAGITLTEAEVVEMVQLMAGLDINKSQAVAAEAVLKSKGNRLNIEAISRAKADVINKSGTVTVKMDAGQGFERIGGYDVLKDWVRQTIIEPLKAPERAKALGMEPPKGAVLFGPPGTGKTVFARALAKELTMPFVELSPEQYMTSLVGESEKNLERTFRVIDAMSPVLVFIDEWIPNRLHYNRIGQVHSCTCGGNPTYPVKSID